MKKSTLNNKGIGPLGVLAVIVVLAVAGGAGTYVYHHNHKTKAKTVASTSSTTSDTSSKSATSTTTAKANPYAGWKTYCNAYSSYCFKYPSNWQLSTTHSQTGPINATVIDPSRTVQVVYNNDSNLIPQARPFVAQSTTKLTTANQALTVVGGYIPSSGNNGVAGNNIPQYEVVDSSLLNTYPLTVGQTDQFPSNPGFTDQHPNQSGIDVSFTSTPAVTINTVSQAQSWLTSADAKTALLILESFTYQQ